MNRQRRAVVATADHPEWFAPRLYQLTTTTVRVSVERAARMRQMQTAQQKTACHL